MVGWWNIVCLQQGVLEKPCTYGCTCARLTAVQRQLFSCSHATVDAILWRSSSVHQNDDVGRNEPAVGLRRRLITAGSKHACHTQLAKHQAFYFFLIFFFYIFEKLRGIMRCLLFFFFLKKQLFIKKQIKIKLRLRRFVGI